MRSRRKIRKREQKRKERDSICIAASVIVATGCAPFWAEAAEAGAFGGAAKETRRLAIGALAASAEWLATGTPAPEGPPPAESAPKAEAPGRRAAPPPRRPQVPSLAPSRATLTVTPVGRSHAADPIATLLIATIADERRDDGRPDAACPAARALLSVYERFVCATPPEVKLVSRHRAEVDFADFPMTLTQIERRGADVLAAQKHVLPAGLDVRNSWRREVDGALVFFDGGASRAALDFGVFEMRLPIATAHGGVGLGPYTRWRENAVIDAAASVSLFEERVEIQAGLAAAETSLVRRTDVEPWLWAYEAHGDAHRDRAGASFVKVAATPIETADLTARIKASFTHTGATFRDFQSDSPGGFLYEGDTLTASAEIEAGRAAFSAQTTQHDDAIYDFSETMIEARRGAISVRAEFGRERAAAEGFAIFDDRRFKGRISVDLEKLAPATSGVAALLPDEIRIGATEYRAASETLSGSENAARRSIGVGARETTSASYTDLYVYWNARDDLSEMSDFRASNAFGVDVSQAFFGDDWDVVAYANMSDVSRTRRFVDDGRERFVSAGVSASKKFENLPRVSVSFDAFKREDRFLSTEQALQNHDLSARAEIELSERLLTGLPFVVDETRPLSLYAAVYRGWSRIDENDLLAAQEKETRFLLTLRRGL